jgi:hypothetical protein
MPLTASSVVHYLLDRGLLDRAGVVDGDVMVLDASRRNRNFKVLRRRGGTGLFVKQAKTLNPDAVASVQREAAVYQLAAADPALDGLRSHLPALAHHDPSEHLLVSHLRAGAVDLTRLHWQLGQAPPHVGAALGEALASVHRAGQRVLASGTAGGLPGQLPWALGLHLPNSPMPTTSMGHVRLVQLVRSTPALVRGLETLRREWQVNTLTHGDMKWDNCLVSAGTSQANDGATVGVTFVDWELADRGDACWDAAALLQGYLTLWVTSLPAVDAPAQRLTASATFPLEALEPALRAFWSGYVAGLELAPDAAARWLDRAARQVAARLVQTAYECVQSLAELPLHVLRLLQLSENIFADPRRAASELLGLSRAG